MATVQRPCIIGLGGTTAPNSSTEQALKIALHAAEHAGAETILFGGPALAQLPHYGPGAVAACAVAKQLVEACRRADGIILASPGYHGTISGLVKNAIDYTEECARDARVYIDGLPVGVIATAHGWQAIGPTLAALRAIAHALRGWPTPLGAGIRTVNGMFQDGICNDDSATRQLEMVGRQVVEFAMMRQRAS